MINRENLEMLVCCAVDEISRRSDRQSYVKEAQKKLGTHIIKSKIKSIILNKMPIQNITNLELYYTSLYLNGTKFLNENLSDYFEKEEIEQYRESNVKEELNYTTIVLHNLIKSEFKEEYVGRITYNEIANLYRQGLITYNVDTQRVADIGKRGNYVFKMPKINKTSINEIKKAVLEGNFQSNTVTFNIRKTGSETYVFSGGEMILDKGLGETSLDVIDGWHRCSGIYEAYRENPNIKGDMTLMVKNLDVDEARLFIIQEAKGNVNNQEGLEFYDVDNNIVKLINDINIYGTKTTNVLFNKISTPIFSQIDATIPFELLAKNIHRGFSKKLNTLTTRDLIVLKRYVVEFYEIFIDTLLEKNGLKTRDAIFNKLQVLNDPMFMSGIMIFAIKAYEAGKTIDDAIDLCDAAMGKINFENDNKNSFVYSSSDNNYHFEKYYKSWERLM